MLIEYGFYIVTPCRCPALLKGFSDWILTASGCFCNTEPEVFACISKSEERREEYRERLGFTREEFIHFAEETEGMFESGRMEEELMERFELKPGKWGLLENSKEEIEAFAAAIQNRGEPVVWIPFEVRDFTASCGRRK